MLEELFRVRPRLRGPRPVVSAWGTAWLLLACGTTPLDSVVAEGVMNNAGTDGGGGVPSAGSGGSTGGTGDTGAVGADGGSVSGSNTAGGGTDAGTSGAAGAAGAPDCQSPAPGRYVIRDRAKDRCLKKGAEDVVVPGIYNALLDADCSSPEAQWDLLEVVPNFYAIHNTGVDANLDVRAGLMSDGTPIVLYLPHASTNQLFALAPRTPPYYALEPQNVLQKCVQAVGSGAQLFPCDTMSQAQDFSLVRVDCP